MSVGIRGSQGQKVPPPPRFMLKTSVELTINGIQALQLQHKGRGGYRLKSSTSFVDETLFGRPAGARPAPPEFDPPWAEKARSGKAVTLTPNSENAKWNQYSDPAKSSSSTPLQTPRKKNKYRLIRRTPSYCDETLFGSREEGPTWEAPWMKKEDAAKLRPLLWSPPSVPWASRSPHPKETPLRAIHPVASSEPKSRNKSDIWQRPLEGLDSPGSLKKGRSHSLNHLNASPGGHSLVTSPPHQRGQQQAWAQTAAVTFRSPLVTPRAHSISLSEPATPRKYPATPKPKPPWK
ncbi:RBPJ-interacting and tubulin-associated protein 1 [Vombatus ursinus]|uniref:RBPJ-interacting and tubulin-associated protein 1 n=1 Tax=Vombatus ursinus TaxID=29139 RepID=A0A4X2K1V5_VOMUR|nr:RBPJ-interacting and tubulin-associated protein 1 [Vombatus ursinus]